MAACGFTLVPCPKECEDEDGAVETFLRKDVASHLKEDCPNRDYVCEHCWEEGTYHSITEFHYHICGKKVVPCPHAGCSEVMPHENLDDHCDKCDYAVVSCKYEGIGCKVEMERRTMAAHEKDDTLHLHKALGAVVKLQGTGKDLEHRLERAEHRLSCVDSIKTFTLHWYKKMKENNRRFVSSPFYTSSNGYKLNVLVHVTGWGGGEGSHVSVYASILKGENDHKLKWPFPGRIFVTMLNQLEDKNHHTHSVGILRNDKVMLSGSGWTSQTFAPHSILTYNRDKNTQYLKDDTLYFRVSFKEGAMPWLECK